MEQVLLTKKGINKLREELEYYKSTKRYEAIEDIKRSRSMSGEITENGEYQEAMAEQAKIERHISNLETKIDNAKVVDVEKIINLNNVSFGLSVVMTDLDTDEELNFQIVGVEEADFKVGKISYQSPIAKEALGKSVGDIIDVETPSGDRELEIVRIENPEA